WPGPSWNACSPTTPAWVCCATPTRGTRRRRRWPASAGCASPCTSFRARRHDQPGPGPGVSFAALWESLLPVGRDGGTGGYRRFSWTPADAECRRWFLKSAEERSLRADADRNGNLWAWWDPPGTAGPGAGPGAVVTGSHLDSVPDGGAFDGPLGVVTAFAAIDLLRERGQIPSRPLGVAAFCEEEGARFGVACLGSRLLAGAIEPDRARGLRDRDGTTFAEAMAAAGQDPAAIGPDPGLVADIAAYVELHIEQGRALAGLDAVVGVARGGGGELGGGGGGGGVRGGGGSRGDHQARRPPRPDAGVRRRNPGRPRGRDPARRPGNGRQGDRGTRRGQRDQFVGDGVAGCP